MINANLAIHKIIGNLKIKFAIVKMDILKKMNIISELVTNFSAKNVIIAVRLVLVIFFKKNFK